jgi:hypothetical protein
MIKSPRMTARGRLRCDEIAPGTFFLGWNAIETRGTEAIKCPVCQGFAERVDCTKAEIASDMNCGVSFSCCIGAFLCAACGKRWVGDEPAPDMAEGE